MLNKLHVESKRLEPSGLQLRQTDNEIIFEGQMRRLSHLDCIEVVDLDSLCSLSPSSDTLVNWL